MSLIQKSTISTKSMKIEKSTKCDSHNFNLIIFTNNLKMLFARRVRKGSSSVHPLHTSSTFNLMFKEIWQLCSQGKINESMCPSLGYQPGTISN